MKITLLATTFLDSLQMENVGVGRLAAFLNEHGHQVIIKYIGNGELAENVVNELDIDCRIFGFSTYNNNIEYFLKLAKLIKNRENEPIIVFGSKFIDLYYDDLIRDPLLANVDFYILGDGEYTFLELINCVDKGADVFELAKINQHLASKEYNNNKIPLSININELPLPDRKWIEETNNISAYICDCHGCTGKCSFCTFIGDYYKKWNGRSAESLFNEVKTLYNNSNVRLFVFTGGSFEDPGELGKQKIMTFCELIITSGIKASFRCYLRANTFSDNHQDINLLCLMKQAGFHVAYVGIESGNDEDLKLYNKRTSLYQNNLTLKLLKQADIYTGPSGFIMFNPYSTIERLRQNYYFLSENHPEFVWKFTSVLVVYRNTPIYTKIKQDGLLLPRTEFDWSELEKFNFVNNDVSELFTFIRNVFYKSEVVMREVTIDSLATFIYSFMMYVEDNYILHNMEKALREFGELSKEYFYYLFVKNDFDYCQNHMNDFLNEIEKIYTKMSLEKNKLIKKLITSPSWEKTII